MLVNFEADRNSRTVLRELQYLFNCMSLPRSDCRSRQNSCKVVNLLRVTAEYLPRTYGDTSCGRLKGWPSLDPQEQRIAVARNIKKPD